MNARQAIPQDVMATLFRALVWCGPQITHEQRDVAWAWLEERNTYEWFGYEGVEQDEPHGEVTQ